jgi:hypothetical protein
MSLTGMTDGESAPPQSPPTPTPDPRLLRSNRLAKASLGWGIAGTALFAAGGGATAYAVCSALRLRMDWQNWLLAAGLTMALLGIYPSIVAVLQGVISLARGTTNSRTAITGLVLGGTVILATLVPVTAFIIYGVTDSFVNTPWKPYQPQF